MTPRKFEFACCFCFEAGQAEGDEPIEVFVVGQRDEEGQTFYAHLECVRRAIHPKAGLEVPFDRDDDEAADEL